MGLWLGSDTACNGPEDQGHLLVDNFVCSVVSASVEELMADVSVLLCGPFVV